jgi:hypothetical protein
VTAASVAMRLGIILGLVSRGEMVPSPIGLGGLLSVWKAKIG